MDALRLYRANRRIRHVVLEFLATRPWDELVENREASFHSLRNVFLHGIEAEDWWFHHVVPGRKEAWVDWDAPQRHPEPYGWATSLDEIRRATRRLEEESEAWLKSLDSTGLAAPVSTKHGPMSVEDVIVHVVTHEFHHRGEMLALWWQRDVEPPLVDLHAYLPTTA